MTRQIILDTETTGLNTTDGHRIIEVGCVELLNRRLTGNHFHRYINPQREIEAGALNVHGITQEFLADKPLFKDIIDDFLSFIKGAQLIIHNAPFDVGFLNYEFQLMGGDYQLITDYCAVLDTLLLARQMHPGQRNSLDALCKRYSIDNSKRELHGALLDAEILALVYLAMTGGQASLFGGEEESIKSNATVLQTQILSSITDRKPLPVIFATPEEMAAHDAFLENIKKESKGKLIWEDS